MNKIGSQVPQLPSTYEKPLPRTGNTIRQLKERKGKWCKQCEFKLVVLKCSTCNTEYCLDCSIHIHKQRCRRRHIYHAIQDITNEELYLMKVTSDNIQNHLATMEGVLGNDKRLLYLHEEAKRQHDIQMAYEEFLNKKSNILSLKIKNRQDRLKGALMCQKLFRGMRDRNLVKKRKVEKIKELKEKQEDMKRKAAVKIQKVVRGMLDREFLKKLKGMQAGRSNYSFAFKMPSNIIYHFNPNINEKEIIKEKRILITSYLNTKSEVLYSTNWQRQMKKCQEKLELISQGYETQEMIRDEEITILQKEEVRIIELLHHYEVERGYLEITLKEIEKDLKTEGNENEKKGKVLHLLLTNYLIYNKSCMDKCLLLSRKCNTKLHILQRERSYSSKRIEYLRVYYNGK